MRKKRTEKVLIKCSNCKKEFFTWESKILRSKNHFCSRKCKDEFQKKQNTIILKETHAELIINSPKYGIKTVLINLDDVDKIKNNCWVLQYTKGINNFYVQTKDQNTKNTIRLHRYLMNCPKDLVVDHINHNTLDNRKSNLRICSQSENMINTNKRVNNTTGYKNIYNCRTIDYYCVAMMRKNKRHTIGYFKKLEDAVLARNNYIKKMGY